MKNKRFNKGVSLSTSCSIFKTAWELPENNGLILPSRVQRHFKAVLPKKPKTKKKKSPFKSKSSAPLRNTIAFTPSTGTSSLINGHSVRSVVGPEPEPEPGPGPGPRPIRSRTMIEMNLPKDFGAESTMNDDEAVRSPLSSRRTIAVSSFPKDLERETVTPGLSQMEHLIDRSTVDRDEQSFDETPSFHHGGSHLKSRTMSLISPQIEYDSGEEDELKENVTSTSKREKMKKTRFATNGKNESVFVDHGLFHYVPTRYTLFFF